MPVHRPKGDKGKCDVLYSLIVRSRGACERCGTTQTLQTAHIISRKYSATRTDERNSFCLCAKDHFYFTNWPVEFTEFIVQTIGQETYDELKRKSQVVTKMNWGEEYDRLKSVANEKNIPQ